MSAGAIIAAAFGLAVLVGVIGGGVLALLGTAVLHLVGRAGEQWNR